MSQILVTSDQLRGLSQQCRDLAGQLRSMSGRLGNAISWLDWQVRYEANVDGEWNDARGRANGLASQADWMAQYLSNKAQAFDSADQQGVSGVGEVAGAFAEAQQGWMLPPGLGLLGAIEGSAAGLLAFGERGAVSVTNGLGSLANALGFRLGGTQNPTLPQAPKQVV